MADVKQGVGNVSEQTISNFSDGYVSDEDNEEVDPRVQDELETLNSASGDINTLETELEKSRNKFRMILTDSTHKLDTVFKKISKSVLKARPYYELLKESRKAQAEAQKAAVNFQRANSIYLAAKEMVQLAEERNNIPDDIDDKKQFDAAWQEMLNHATIKFMESEKEKTRSEAEHSLKAKQYEAIQQKLRSYEKEMPKSIEKAKAYFDLKDKLEKQLQIERVNVEDLQMGLLCAKQKYKTALRNLEAISDEIHEKRKKRLMLPPRTPGVGAESDVSSLPEISLDNLSDFGSQISIDDRDADGVSVADDNVSVSDTSLTPVKPLGDPSREPKLPACRRDEVVEGSEMTPSGPSSEEPLRPRIPDYQLKTCEPDTSHSREQTQKPLVTKPQPSATSSLACDSHRTERRHHQHKPHSQAEFPILQHLRDNHRQNTFTSSHISRTGGAMRRHASGDRSSGREERENIQEEVFV